jgi:hypothetical protein
MPGPNHTDDTGSLAASSTTVIELPQSEKAMDTDKPTTSSEWHLSSEMRRLEQLESDTDDKPRSLGVSWNNLTIKGINSGATFNENVLSQFNPFHKSAKGDLKTIIDNSHGCVKPGEMYVTEGCNPK